MILRSDKRSVIEVQRQSEEALNLVRLAAAAYRDRLAGLTELYAEAERSYEMILAAICKMTDEEADLIEPIFTQFELEFNDLSMAAPPITPISSNLRLN